MTHESQKPQRILSIDAYRGLVMLLMIGSGLQLYNVAKKFPDSPVWQSIGFHTNHVPWSGGSLHDMIQPGFSFLVGVALPFSIASRQAKGQGFARMFFHAVIRALLLIALGVFLRSNGFKDREGHYLTNFTFEDTLSQIGLGYVFLFLIGWLRPTVWHWICFVLVVAGYWAAFAMYPVQTPAGVPEDWPYNYSGFMAHWNKNSNLAWRFDVWFLNL